MSSVKYVRLDPTGNITCLVLEKPPEADERTITDCLMRECEQVAYLEKPVLPGSRARVRLMGGEFCGNAAMAAACWLARTDGIRPGEHRVVPIEMSGMEGVMPCHVHANADSYDGTVPMPPVRDIHPFSMGERQMAAVHLEGIAHLILEGKPFPTDREAEMLLQTAASELPEEAVGLLLWDETSMYMRPLVLVKGSETLVWETGCGSGSACVGAWRAHQGKATVTDVHQPGGVIRVAAERSEHLPGHITISGTVRIEAERVWTL